MSYNPHVRVTPPAGAATDFDLTLFDRLITQKLFPEEIVAVKETVRRRVRTIFYGWRLRALLEWVIEPGSASEAFPDQQHATAGIIYLRRLARRRDTKLELNMNGGGQPYRECILTECPPPVFVEDKHVLALYRMEFTCVDLLSEDSLPPEVAQSPGGLLGWYGMI